LSTDGTGFLPLPHSTFPGSNAAFFTHSVRRSGRPAPHASALARNAPFNPPALVPAMMSTTTSTFRSAQNRLQCS
jgi:hypothetical protein